MSRTLLPSCHTRRIPNFVVQPASVLHVMVVSSHRYMFSSLRRVTARTETHQNEPIPYAD